MCGRFALYSSLPVLIKAFAVDTATCVLKPRYNIAPADRIAAVIRREEIRLGWLTWGLVPAWARNPAQGKALINARFETLAEKPSFREAYRQRRCLIPADGFYEWETGKERRQPWYFTLADDGPFAFAGLWETWKGEKKETLSSCAIVTMAAGDAMRAVHHRMPVILSPEACADWLDPAIRDPEKLDELIRTGHATAMKRFPVSKRVNSPAHDDPGCIVPQGETRF